MSAKPRKAFDGVGRPQGFIDDAAKVLLKASKRVVNMGKKGEASMLSPMSKKKFDRIYGKGSAEQVAEQTKKNAYRNAPSKPRTTADQKVASRQRDENIRANINRAEGAPRIGSNSKKRRPVRGY
jgi:hypothetical protein